MNPASALRDAPERSVSGSPRLITACDTLAGAATMSDGRASGIIRPAPVAPATIRRKRRRETSASKNISTPPQDARYQNNTSPIGDRSIFMPIAQDLLLFKRVPCRFGLVHLNPPPGPVIRPRVPVDNVGWSHHVVAPWNVRPDGLLN